MQAVQSAPLLIQPSIPSGKIKTFGAFGPKYQVGNSAHQLESGDWLVEIRMLESGETAEYSLFHIDADPEAR